MSLNVIPDYKKNFVIYFFGESETWLVFNGWILYRCWIPINPRAHSSFIWTTAKNTREWTGDE